MTSLSQGNLLQQIAYHTINDLYTIPQMLMLRRVGDSSNPMINLNGTSKTTEQGVLGLANTVSLGYSYALRGATVGANVAKTGTSTLPTQIHHFATNKHSIYTKKMSAIAKKYGLDLNETWNEAAMPHLGKHPKEYHEFVLQAMERASIEAGGDQAKFLQLFDKYVKQPVLQNPKLLRKSGW